MHLITPFKCMLTLALHLPCNWRPQNGTMNKAERAERTPPVLPLHGLGLPFLQTQVADMVVTCRWLRWSLSSPPLADHAPILQISDSGQEPQWLPWRCP